MYLQSPDEQAAMNALLSDYDRYGKPLVCPFCGETLDLAKTTRNHNTIFFSVRKQDVLRFLHSHVAVCAADWDRRLMAAVNAGLAVME